MRMKVLRIFFTFMTKAEELIMQETVMNTKGIFKDIFDKKNFTLRFPESPPLHDEVFHGA